MRFWIFWFALVSNFASAAYLDVSLVREGKTSKIDYRLTSFAKQLVKTHRGSLQFMVEAESELKKITRFARAELRAQQSKILLFANGILIDTPKTPEDPCCDGFWNGFWQGLSDTLHGKTLKEDLGAFASGAVFGPILKSLLNNLPHGKLLALGGVIAFSKDFLESKVTGYQTNQKGWSNSFIWGRVVFDFVKELALVTIGMKSSEGLGKLLAKIAKKNPWAKYLIDFFMEAFTPSPETKAKNETYLKKQKKVYDDTSDNNKKNNNPSDDDHSGVHVTYPKPSPKPTTPVTTRVPGRPVTVRAPVATTKPSGVATLEQPSAPSPSNPSILNNAAPSTANVQTVGNPHKDFINWRKYIDLEPEYKAAFDRIGEALKNPANLVAPAAMGAIERKDFKLLRGIPGLPTSVKTFASSVPPPEEEPTPLPQPSDYSKFLREALYFGGITLEHINALQTFYNLCRKNNSSDGDCEKARTILRDRKMSKYLEEAYDGQRETHHILALNWHYKRCLESGSQSADCLKTRAIFLELAKTYEVLGDDEPSSLSDAQLIANLRRACYFYESLVNVAETDPLLKTALDGALKALVDHLKHGRGLVWKDTTKNGDLHLILALFELEAYQTDVEQLPAHLRFPTLWKEAFSSISILDYFSISFPFKKTLAVFNKPLWHLTKFVGAISFESLYRELVTDIQTRGHWSQEHVMALATLATMPEDDENPVDSLREFAIETLRQFGIRYARKDNLRIVILSNPVNEATSLKEAHEDYANYREFMRVLRFLHAERGTIPEEMLKAAREKALELMRDEEDNLDDDASTYNLRLKEKNLSYHARFFLMYALPELIRRELPQQEKKFLLETDRVDLLSVNSSHWWIQESPPKERRRIDFSDLPTESRAYLAVLDALHTLDRFILITSVPGHSHYRVDYAPGTLMPLMSWMKARLKPVYDLEPEEFRAAWTHVLPIFQNRRFLKDLDDVLNYLHIREVNLETFQRRAQEIQSWMQSSLDEKESLPPTLPLPESTYDEIKGVDQLPHALRIRLRTPFYFRADLPVDPAHFYQIKARDAVKQIEDLIPALDPRDRLYQTKDIFSELRTKLNKAPLAFAILFTDQPLSAIETNTLVLNTLIFTYDTSKTMAERILALKEDASLNLRRIKNLENKFGAHDPELVTLFQNLKSEYFNALPMEDDPLRLAAEIVWLDYWTDSFGDHMDYWSNKPHLNRIYKESLEDTLYEDSHYTPEQIAAAEPKMADATQIFGKILEPYKAKIKAIKKR